MSNRVATGRLHRIHRGVFAVGHPLLSTEGKWMAAVLACGPGAVLSHRSAAAHWGLRPSDRSVTDVSSRARTGRAITAIDAHRGDSLCDLDVTSLSRIPCTTPSRTLLDLATTIDRASLLRALDRAEELRLFDGEDLKSAIDRAGGHPGIGALRRALAECSGGPSLTRSELEDRFFAICQSAGVAPPRVNATVEVEGGAIEVDFLWPGARLVVETDGRRFHLTGRAFERDRRRDQLLTLAGWRVIRCTWRQVAREPEVLAGTLRALIFE